MSPGGRASKQVIGMWPSLWPAGAYTVYNERSIKRCGTGNYAGDPTHYSNGSPRTGRRGIAPHILHPLWDEYQSLRLSRLVSKVCRPPNQRGGLMLVSGQGGRQRSKGALATFETVSQALTFSFIQLEGIVE